MKPEGILPVSGPEQMPAHREGVGEHGKPERKPETGTDNSAERNEQVAELQSAVADVGITTVLPTPVGDSATASQPSAVPIQSPIIAKDDDLIEKEWVDKAKRIVEETKNDPHKREDEVGKLRVDYLKKRFGRELGSAK